jgi:hypothetical protein
MRPHAFLFRLCILAGLVATSAMMGGWKWDLLPH